jgi:CheY-like chemotaxis protein/ribosome-associated translation inhibitor RaiA
MTTRIGRSVKRQWQPKTETDDKKYRILLAEDDLEMRKMIAWSLREEGFDVTECKDGNSLIKRAGLLDSSRQTNFFDLIISDIRMPGVTGMQVLEGVKDYMDFPPIILITAFGDEDTHINAKKSGAAMIIDKPFDMEDLLEKISQVIPFRIRSKELQMLSIARATIIQFPMDIIFRHGCGSEPIRGFIQEHASRLNHFDTFIQHCHVMVDNRCLVTATVSCTGKIMVAKHSSGKTNSHDNLYLAIQIVFDKLYHQVKKYHRKRNNNKLYSSFAQGEQI